MSASSATSQFVISRETPVYLLDCEKAFAGLTPEEQRYAHYLGEACFNGSPAVLYQTSPESPLLVALFLRYLVALRAQDPALKVPEDLAVYLSHLFTNMGNYKSFGDSKFIPAIPRDELRALLAQSPVWATQLEPLWAKVHERIYSVEPREQQLGFGPTDGISTYYSLDTTKEEAEMIQKYMDEVLHLSPYNTRLFKTGVVGGIPQFELRLASATKGAGDDPVSPLLKAYETDKFKVTVTRGDYTDFMQLAVDNLKKAKQYASNDNERNMLENYIKSFEFGSIDFHKDGSRDWIKDKGPVVETYIGFIESYRDPLGVRGEWEGFVAIVNKEVSRKYAVLVDKATELLPLLPWPKELEKDVFLRPDFTSLEVLGFAGSGIPAGINIPNYDDIRQDEGFKNVSLGNVLSARSGKDPVTFLAPADQTMYQDLQGKSFEVQVALHELLGHGSGKLLTTDASGKKNFPAGLLDPLTKQPPSTYAPGKTYDSVFAEMGSAFEECRAESVGIYLSLFDNVLKVLGYEGEAASDIQYINWLHMARAGLLALEFYTPATQTWRQAHSHARHAILRVLLEAGEGLVTIERTQEDGAPSAVLRLDRSKIQTVGKVAMEKFLLKIQVYKSTANYEEAKKMFNHYTNVNEDLLALREIVLSKKKPRPIYSQARTTIDESGKVTFIKYDNTHQDVIKSFVDRFAGLEDKIEAQWERDHPIVMG